MDAVIALSAILGALAIGVVSPGPSFVLVARTAIAASRLDGLAAALGMGLGGALFGSLALFGLTALLAHAGWLYVALKLAGGAYLVYLGILIWRGAAGSVRLATGGEPGAARNAARSFWIGLATQVSNPKTAVIYASVFAALMPPSPPLWFILVLPPLLFAIEAGWYAVVALAFSAGRPRAAYLRAKTAIDRLAGVVMAGLGIRLLYEAARRG
jgi:threonine/homoserine/homoserine lactone efflux protein